MLNFLKKIFGSGSAKKQPNFNQQRPSSTANQSKTKFQGVLQTNAPVHWPRLKINWEVQTFPTDRQNALLSSLMYNAKIIEALGAFHQVKEKSSYAEDVDNLEGVVCGSSSVKQPTQDGIILLSAAIKEQGKKYPVMVFEEELNQLTIDRFNALLKPYRYEDLIWYAPAPPNQSNAFEIHKI